MTEELHAKRRMGTAMPIPAHEGLAIHGPDDADTFQRAEAWKGYTDKLEKRLPRLYTATDKEKLPSDAWNEWSAYINPDFTLTRRIRERFAEGRGLTIVGEPGSGKTRLAVLLAAAAATLGVWPKFLSAGTLRSAAFASFEASDKLIKEYTKPRLLVLDDLGKGAPSNQADELAFQILDNRTMDEKSTIVTSQYSPELLAARFNDEQTAKGVLRRIGSDFNETIILKPNQPE